PDYKLYTNNQSGREVFYTILARGKPGILIRTSSIQEIYLSHHEPNSAWRLPPRRCQQHFEKKIDFPSKQLGKNHRMMHATLCAAHTRSVGTKSKTPINVMLSLRALPSFNPYLLHRIRH
ncbi:unnamed protein product, partial [Ectocarpus sp. 12 AP-2014]